MTDAEQDERKHCEREVANTITTDELGREFVQVLVCMLFRERAAARQEGDQAGYERGRAERTEEIERLRLTACEYDYYCRKGRLCRNHQDRVGKIDDELIELKSKHDRLVAASRAYRAQRLANGRVDGCLQAQALDDALSDTESTCTSCGRTDGTHKYARCAEAE